MLILVLAANTAYADFPRLASILARDRYVPRQLMNQGDRLAFSNGIVGLSIFASVLLVVYGGDTHSLIPLYMIGVFVSFTLSQAGMVAHWRRLRGPGWKTSAFINGFGALVTGIVLIVVAVTKAHEGAWIILLLIPVHVFFFRVTKRHYDIVAAQLSLKGWANETPRRHNTVLVPISGVHRAVVQAVEYAKTLSPDVRAVYVNVDPVVTERLRGDWEQWGQGVPLVVLESPYRSLMEPFLEYIEQVDARAAGRLPHRRAAGVRAGEVVAPSVPQSTRAPDQGRAAVQAERRRHERAVPLATLTTRASVIGMIAGRKRRTPKRADS